MTLWKPRGSRLNSSAQVQAFLSKATKILAPSIGAVRRKSENAHWTMPENRLKDNVINLRNAHDWKDKRIIHAGVDRHNTPGLVKWDRISSLTGAMECDSLWRIRKNEPCKTLKKQEATIMLNYVGVIGLTRLPDRRKRYLLQAQNGHQPNHKHWHFEKWSHFHHYGVWCRKKHPF